MKRQPHPDEYAQRHLLAADPHSLLRLADRTGDPEIGRHLHVLAGERDESRRKHLARLIEGIAQQRTQGDAM